MSKSTNIKIKHEYKQYILESNGKSESSYDQIRYAINLYEEFTNFDNFKSFNKQNAIDFKHYLLEIKSKSTARRILINIKDLFKWLSCQPGFRKYIKLTDCEYFNLSKKNNRQALAVIYKDFSNIDDIKKVIFSMPNNTDIEKRNQALIAFNLITVMRIEAIMCVKLKHINLEKELIIQDGIEIKTKNSKVIYTFFFNINNDIKQIVIDWIKYLKSKNYTDNDPLFPKNHIETENFAFVCKGLSKEHWQQTTQARGIFKEAFEKAGVKFHGPHSFRHTVTHLGQERCTTAEEFKAWSQNIGHDNMLVLRLLVMGWLVLIGRERF